MASAYEILGVPRDASADVIRQAYRRLARSAHPDRHGGDQEAHENFLAIHAAYEVLSDPQRRVNYDLDPTGMLESQLILEKRKAQRLRRRMRLRRLYD